MRNTGFHLKNGYMYTHLFHKVFQNKNSATLTLQIYGFNACQLGIQIVTLSTLSVLQNLSLLFLLNCFNFERVHILKRKQKTFCKRHHRKIIEKFFMSSIAYSLFLLCSNISSREPKSLIDSFSNHSSIVVPWDIKYSEIVSIFCGSLTSSPSTSLITPSSVRG